MATYKIDPSHSEISFKVKHLMITTVTGKFEQFNGTLSTPNGTFDNADISFTADVDSISTSNEQRDTHLKSDDFFNAEQFPKLSFKSTAFEKKSDDEYVLKGDLTIRDVTKPVELTAEYNGEMVDPWGQKKLGFEINGKLKRTDYNLKWNAVTEAGGMVVSDEVKLHLNVQLVAEA